MRLDHLLYVGPDLAELVHDVKRLSGLGAAAGGQHPGQGTHNAASQIQSSIARSRRNRCAPIGGRVSRCDRKTIRDPELSRLAC